MPEEEGSKDNLSAVVRAIDRNTRAVLALVAVTADSSPLVAQGSSQDIAIKAVVTDIATAVTNDE